jgi:ABC-2 type transport system permease protein
MSVDGPGLYLAYQRAYLRGRMDYRWQFVGDIAAGILGQASVVASLWLVTHRFTEIAGWTFPELAVLYSLSMLTFALAGMVFWPFIYLVDGLVVSGRLDQYFLRPRGLVTQLVCGGAGINHIGGVSVGVATLVIGLHALAARLSALKIAYLAAAIAGGAMLQAAGILTVAGLSFWLMRSSDLGDIIFYNLQNFLSYPLTIYPGFLKVLLTAVVPLAFVNWYPSLVLLDRCSGTLDLALGLAAPAVGVVAFLGALALFRRGERRYASSGS